MEAAAARIRNLMELDSITSAINTATEVIPYMLSILPDAILPAAGFHALFTLSSAYGMFFASLIEARLLLWGTQALSYHYSPDDGGYGRNSLCSNKITHGNPGNDFMDGPTLAPYTFPSTPMYMLSVAASYVFNTLNAQSKELETLGPAFSTRYYVSLTFLIGLIVLIGAFRMVYTCESFFNIITSSAIGIIIGFALVVQNKRLFGDGSINMLGIPHLRNRTASGKKIYVCPK
jgi:hypothetical protein